MDEVTQVKNQYRMEQWIKLIQECQQSGMTVRSWCRQNNVKEPTYYYYYLKKIRKAACKELPSMEPAERKPLEFQKLQVESGGRI